MSTGAGPGDDVLNEDLEEIISEIARLQTTKMFVGAVAVVVSYEDATQKASVRPVVRGSVQGGGSVRFPVLTNVPVRFPCGGGYSVTFPLKAGDFVWLDFGDRSLDDWLNSGQADVVPASKRRFSISDAVAYAGVRPFSKPLKRPVPTTGGTSIEEENDLVIGQDDYDGPISNPGKSSPLEIRIGPSGILVGDGTSDNDLLNILDRVLTALIADSSLTTSVPLMTIEKAKLLLIRR